MKVSTEKPEPGVATLTVEVPADELDRAVEQAWRRLANRVNIPGFRRGKAPRILVERQVGAAAIDEEALRRLLPERYDAAVDETKIEPIERPRFDVVQLERGKPLIFSATVAVRPTVELGDYHTLQIEPEAVLVDDEQVARVVERLRDSQAQWVPVEDRGLEMADMAIADITMGLPAEGGRQAPSSERKDSELILGANGFPEGFDTQMLGARPGDTREFTVSYAAGGSSAASGERERNESGGGGEGGQAPPEPERRTVAFIVHVKDVKRKQLPALDDALARSLGDHDTLAALEADVRRRLLEEAERAARVATESKAVDAAVARATFEIPARLVELEADALVEERRQALAEQGITLERFLQILGRPQEEWRAEQREQATRQVKARLVLDAVADREGLAVSPAEVQQEIDRTAAPYGERAGEVRRSLLTDEARQRLSTSLRRHKAVERLVEHAGGYPPSPLLAPDTSDTSNSQAPRPAEPAATAATG